MRIFILTRPDFDIKNLENLDEFDFFLPTNQICFHRLKDENIASDRLLNFCNFITQDELDKIDLSARELIVNWKNGKDLRDRANHNAIFYRFREVEYFKHILSNLLNKYCIDEILYFNASDEPLAFVLANVGPHINTINCADVGLSPYMPYISQNYYDEIVEDANFDLIFIATAVPNIEKNIEKFLKKYSQVLVVMDLCFSGNISGIINYFSDNNNVSFKIVSPENGRFYELGENDNYILEVDRSLSEIINQKNCAVVISDNVHIENSLALFHARKNRLKVHVIPHSVRPIDEIVTFDFEDLEGCEYIYLQNEPDFKIGISYDANFINILRKTALLPFRVIRRVLEKSKDKHLGIVVTTDQIYNYLRYNILNLCEDILEINTYLKGRYNIIIRLREFEDSSTLWLNLMHQSVNANFQYSNQDDLFIFIKNSIFIVEVGNRSSLSLQSVKILTPYFNCEKRQKSCRSNEKFDDISIPIEKIKDIIRYDCNFMNKFRLVGVVACQYFKFSILNL